MSGAKTAFITGASSGIGAALAKQLADDGIEVALAARREAELRKVADEIEKAGGRARVYPLDVSDAEATTATVLRADDDMGGLDIVVANAGIAKMQWSGNMTWGWAAPMLHVNVIGATATLCAAIPRMLERQRGHLVGVSSIAAYRGLPKTAVYSGTKAYLSTFLESLRVDLSGKGITVTDIRPGYVRTALTEGSKNLPFIIEAPVAAREIADAIAAGKDVHAFPLPMALGIRGMAALPNLLYDKLAPKVT